MTTWEGGWVGRERGREGGKEKGWDGKGKKGKGREEELNVMYSCIGV